MTQTCGRSGFLLVALSLSLLASSSFAATLTAGQVSASSGESNVKAPLSLASAGNEDVCAIQTDVLFDASALVVTGVEIGTAAAAAGKEANYSEIESGRIRILIAGFNQNVIADGVVANIIFRIPATTGEAAYSITPADLLLSDPYGVSVPGTAVAGSVTVACAAGCFGASITTPNRSLSEIEGDVLLLMLIAAVLILKGRSRKPRRANV